jgi:hypothetical protein
MIAFGVSPPLFGVVKALSHELFTFELGFRKFPIRRSAPVFDSYPLPTLHGMPLPFLRLVQCA